MSDPTRPVTSTIVISLNFSIRLPALSSARPAGWIMKSKRSRRLSQRSSTSFKRSGTNWNHPLLLLLHQPQPSQPALRFKENYP